MNFSALRHFTTSLALASAFASTAIAQDRAGVEALFDTVGLPEMIEIMREEGLTYGAEIGEGIFNGSPSPDWNDAVSGIYDADRMQSSVLDELVVQLEGDDVEAIQEFFGSELGQRIVSLEIAARRALLDDTVEAASKEVAALAMADETPRYELVTDFIDANDLIETNVAGAMNSNFAFYLGLMQGGALGEDLSEAQILENLWGQEPEIRQNTVEWVYSFLMLAYQPLSDDELRAYTAFSMTDAGKDMNAAMFASFDGIFEDISRALAFASTQATLTEEL